MEKQTKERPACILAEKIAQRNNAKLNADIKPRSSDKTPSVCQSILDNNKAKIEASDIKFKSLLMEGFVNDAKRLKRKRKK